MRTTIGYSTFASPLGDMLLVASGEALRGIYFFGQKYEPQPDEAWRDESRRPVLRAASNQLSEYFRGLRPQFDLTLAPSGTPFQQAVWSAIAAVPWGVTISYTDLARRIGRPESVRAVGAATGRNPLSIVVPCHRIVGAGGALTGYAGGLDRKRALLALEQSGARRAA